MNKTQAILDSIGVPLFSAGFTNSRHDEDSWVFTKLDGYLEQEIIITDRMNHLLGAFFQTNVPQDGIIKILTLKDILPKSKYNGDSEGFFSYDSKSNFNSMIAELSDTIIEYGLPALDGMSKPLPKGRVTLDDEKTLYINHLRLAEEYSERLNINILDINKDIENIQIIIHKIEKLKKTKFQLIEKDLIGLAALYGTIFEKKLNWEWLLHPAGICYVTDVYYNLVHPLADVFNTWNNEIGMYLIDNYRDQFAKDREKMELDIPDNSHLIHAENPQTRQEKLDFFELKKGYGYTLQLYDLSDDELDSLFEEFYPLLKDKKECVGDPYCIRCNRMAEVGKDIICDCGVNRAVYDEADWKEDIEKHTERLPKDKKFIKNGYRIRG